MKGSEDRVIFGSSNMTLGGFQNNLEFDISLIPNNTQKESLNTFFSYCLRNAESITEQHIKYYKDHSDAIQSMADDISQYRRRLKSLLGGIHTELDPFSNDEYRLDNFIFNYTDYEIFFDRNRRRNDGEMSRKRKVVQEKLLHIHNALYPEIKRLNLSCHRNAEHITSLTYPCDYNHHQVGWMGVRYGKTPRELDLLNQGADRTDALGFQKHACLQFCIGSLGFEINLFFAVRNDAYDRAWLKEHLEERRPEINQEALKLEGFGYKWRIENDSVPEESKCFDFDTEDNFCEFFNQYDEAGYESYLIYLYKPDADVLTDERKLIPDIFMHFKRLLPLYHAMVQRL